MLIRIVKLSKRFDSDISGVCGAFALRISDGIVKEARVAASPGVGFGQGGEGHVRFALIENEHRIGQAVRNLRKALTKL